MVIHGCIGYSSGCRCPRCARRRQDRRYRDQAVAVPRGKNRRPPSLPAGAAVAARITPEYHDSSSDSGASSWPAPPTPLTALASPASGADLIGRLCGQITSLRQIAAAHSPGQPSVELHQHQTQQLISLLEHHRDQLRDFLNNGPIDADAEYSAAGDLGAEETGTWQTA
ncbi:hypothetical protein [Mycobacteroides abscessus]|uniref:hypothetical protein n=1 Tax=Mycobacteroides abscessus TaxID=36809 RepID=UPI00092CC7FE|nr:hypothetical protein [Mycobacteroides abscessus]SIN56188.1 Uncharacterised protein [Mycobacteroides abscessus subsp. abscessus]